MKTTLVVALLLLATTASASTIEDTIQEIDPSFHYQEDAGIPGDAPDTCPELEPERALLPDARINATMVQEDDESDVFAVPLSSESIGDRMRLSVIPGTHQNLYEFAFDIFDVDCGFSIFDAGSPLYDRSRYVPSDPVSPGAGEVEHTYTFDGEYPCDPDEWKFLLKHAQGIWPDELYVEWTDGSYAYLEGDQGLPSQVAKYTTSHNLDHTIKRVMAAMPTGWTGELSIAHGPCDVTEPEPYPVPYHDHLTGEFTVVEAGTYVLHVYISKDAVETTLDEANETLAPILDPLTPQPASCHHRGCKLVLDELTFNVDLDNLSVA